jgi:histidyl-tRNA synthetase
MKQDSTKLIKNLPPKGTTDWLPEEYKIRKYIFDTFRKVCVSFGYEEYLTPTFEKAEIYKAKSGEDVGGKELITFKDKVNREFALRPEMTPSVIRMTTRIYNNQPKPIRFFSIANFFRNEKPQRGRNREFWQLNYDIFGSRSIYADVEIVKIALEIMFAFLPKDKITQSDYKPFVIYINDRRILNHFLEKDLKIPSDKIEEIVRILDKKDKIKEEEFNSRLKQQNLTEEQIKRITSFLNGEIEIDKEITKELNQLLDILKREGYEKWIEFKPGLVRGFDYYNGIVYEVYDNDPENNRALFGGGRYDGLGKIFGDYDIPAVGVAPGDETLKLFLENWGLLENIEKDKKTSYYIPIIEEEARKNISQIAKKLKQENNIVIEGLEKQSLTKSLEFANKKNIDKVIIIGSNELEKGQYLEKDMKTGNQNVIIL